MVGWTPPTGPMGMTAADWRRMQQANPVQLGQNTELAPGAFNPVEALKPSGYAPQVKKGLNIQGAWRTNATGRSR